MIDSNSARAPALCGRHDGVLLETKGCQGCAIEKAARVDAEKKYEQARRHIHRWWGTGDVCGCCGEPYPEDMRERRESGK